MTPDDVRQRVLFGLAKRDVSNVKETLAAITEASAEGLGVARVGIWRIPNDHEIVCEELYIRSEHRHTTAGHLWADDHPAYFAALLEQRTITAPDVLHDPRTATLRDEYLVPLGITSMMDVPIWHRGRVYGVLCNEHVGPPRQWTADDVAFATNLADIASLSLEASERRLAEQRWRTVIEAIPEGVMVVRPDGHVERMNPTMRALLEQAGDGDVEERLRLLQCVDVNGAPLPAERSPFRRVLLCGDMVAGEIVGVRLQNPDRFRYLRLTVTRLVEEGETSAMVVVVSDISEELRFEHIKRDFLDALAHELKTPVAIAKGYAKLLARTATLPEEQLAMLSAIIRGTDRMDRLIQGLVDVSTLLLGKLSFDRDRISFSEIVTRVVEQVTARTGRRVEVQLSDEGFVRGDLARIEQAVRQIVDNAVGWSPEGRAPTVKVERTPSAILLTVHDLGAGLTSDQLEHVFDLFQWMRTDVDDPGGLGTGLFLAREIARRHGGDVTVASRPGEGTTVTLRLPIEET